MRAARLVMGIFYVGAGVLHFVATQQYMAVIPEYLPTHRALVLVSGGAEIVGGIGVLIPWPAVRRTAAWGLVALLIAVSPVHINMCLHPDRFPGIPLWAIWLRLPLQLPLIAWAWSYTRTYK